MDSDEKQEVYYLGEVRGNGKLLFKLAVVEGGISIILKKKGDAELYCIPIYFLLEPFVCNIEEAKRCAQISEYMSEKNDEKEM